MILPQGPTLPGPTQTIRTSGHWTWAPLGSWPHRAAPPLPYWDSFFSAGFGGNGGSAGGATLFVAGATVAGALVLTAGGDTALVSEGFGSGGLGGNGGGGGGAGLFVVAGAALVMATTGDTTTLVLLGGGGAVFVSAGFGASDLDSSFFDSSFFSASRSLRSFKRLSTVHFETT